MPRPNRNIIGRRRSRRADQEPDPSRYDEALYGEPDPGAQDRSTIRPMRTIPTPIRPAMTKSAEEPAPKRRGGMTTVVAVLALAVFGTGAAFAYRTYVGSPRSGEPPIIRADTGPTKIVPASAEPAPRCRTAWRQATAPKRSSRARKRRSTSTPADPAPRMVFPPLSPNANPPPLASVAPTQRRRRRTPATARCRTTSRARSRPFGSR